MDAVYITSYPGRPCSADSVIEAPTQHHTTTNAQQPQQHANATAGLHRRWNLTVCINNQYQHAAEITLVDPFADAYYRSVFEEYLHKADHPSWTTLATSLAEARADRHGGGSDGDDYDDVVKRMEQQMYDYARSLLGQLRLRPALLRPKATDLQIHVIEQHQETDHDADGTGAAGIHCLAWELLESVHIPALPNLRLRVSRVTNFPFPLGRPLMRRTLTARSLADVQADPDAAYRVLLVVARDFSLPDDARDVEPDLAQFPLMTLRRRLQSRMVLEVVRPGTLEELAAHLRTRSRDGLHFNLVHFDMHGQVSPDEYGVPTPGLLFAKRTYATQSNGYHVPQTRLAKAVDVADLLVENQVENVVLNSCLSAYNRSTSLTNLAHIFLRRGIQNISAMWFYVHSKTVETYLETFYNQLLLKGVDFHVAAQHGRQAVRLAPTMRAGRPCKDDFVCVNYAHQVHRLGSLTTTATTLTTTTTLREPSPALLPPSDKSQSSSSSHRSLMSVGGWKKSSTRRDTSPTPSSRSRSSSTSNTSIKSVLSGSGGGGSSGGGSSGWRKPSPRLADSLLLMTDEPVMRMQLHLLELEYKLATFRIVYASDLHRAAHADLEGTMARMVSMWLSTNMIDEVCYYRAKDFARPRSTWPGTSTSSSNSSVPYREKKTRNGGGGGYGYGYAYNNGGTGTGGGSGSGWSSNGHGGGSYLQFLFPPRPVKALRSTLHIIRGVDDVVAPGWRADEATNMRNEERRVLAQEGLQRFARRLHTEEDSYCLFLGSHDAQWFRRFLQHLHGAWWVHLPWGMNVPSRSPIPRGGGAGAGGGRADETIRRGFGSIDSVLNLDNQLGIMEMM